MSDLRKFFGFISAFALLLFLAAGQAEAGPYAGVKVLLDAEAAETFDATGADFLARTNDGVTEALPPKAGEQIAVEIYVASAPANWGSLTAFRFDDTDSVFTSNFTADSMLVDPEAGKLVTLRATGAVALAFAALPFKANNLIGTYWLTAKKDIAEGTTLSLEVAVIQTGSIIASAEDSMDVSDAVITFQTPTEPPKPSLGADLAITDPITVKRDPSAPADTITISASSFAATDTITWSVATTGGFDITVLDADGMMMDEMMFQTPGMTSIMLYASGTSDAGSVAIYAYTATDTTDTITIEFSLENPVELASFGGELAEDRVMLSWTTASQTNNAGWLMLRSVDGETYEVISQFISGAGTSDALLSYNFADEALPSAETVFYVLEQVDLDGTIHRSNAVEVVLGARFADLPAEFGTNVYPNPFNPTTTISYDLPGDALVSIVIYDAIGQEVRRLVNEQRPAGRYHIQWDARDNLGRSVGSGVYIAKVEAGSFSASQKMLLLK